MSLPPVVTYVSVAYTTATEAPNVSETEITITTTLLNTLPTPTGTSSASSPSPTTSAISPPSDSTSCSTTSATSSSTSSSTTSSTISTTSSTSANSAVPASATLSEPTTSGSPIPSTPGISGLSISLPGIIGLLVALVIFFAAIIVLFCYYRRKRKFHKKAMLIAPRLSQRTHKGHPSIETWEETLVGTGSRGDSFEKDIKLGAIHSNASARHVLPSISSDMASLAYNTYISHRSDWNLATTRPTEVLGPVVTEQRSVGSSIYGIRYNPGGTLSVDYEGTEQRHPADDENTPGWDEALARLNAIHSASLRREPSPPPLRIVKRSASNPENQVHPTGRNLRHPTHSDLESISELDMSDSPRDRNIERQRGAALAKLEGRLVASNNRYTTESIYSRSSDGTPFHRPEDGEGRPQWRNLQRHWPD